MSISPATPNAPAYHTPAINNKQTNNPLDTIEGKQAKFTRLGDTVSISQEASQKARLEEYPLQSDPVELFNEWKLNDGIYANLGPGPKSYKDLLPENQELTQQLKREMERASEEERRLLQADIDTLSRFGDKEIFSNRQDISKRLNVENIASSLKYAYAEKEYGKVPLPSGLEYMEGDRSTSVPPLSQSQY